MNNNKGFRSGFVTIVGKPNVGKSTLMNALVGEKVAIVSPKPQTTRNRIIGIRNGENYQLVFVDTPGIHKPRTRLGSFMDQSVQEALKAIDGLILMVDVTNINQQDHQIAKEYSELKIPRLLAINKVDLVHPQDVLPIIEQFSQYHFDALIPLSAKKREGMEPLQDAILSFLPHGPQYYPNDQWTDQTERQIVAELIREQALYALQEEVPHGIGVDILSLTEKSPTLTEIFADIYCERASHKGIIIGKQGTMLQQIGSKARQQIEALLNTQVNLKLWVKVRADWRNSPNDLKTLGYSE